MYNVVGGVNLKNYPFPSFPSFKKPYCWRLKIYGLYEFGCHSKRFVDVWLFTPIELQTVVDFFYRLAFLQYTRSFTLFLCGFRVYYWRILSSLGKHVSSLHSIGSIFAKKRRKKKSFIKFNMLKTEGKSAEF